MLWRMVLSLVGIMYEERRRCSLVAVLFNGWIGKYGIGELIIVEVGYGLAVV